MNRAYIGFLPHIWKCILTNTISINDWEWFYNSWVTYFNILIDISQCPCDLITWSYYLNNITTFKMKWRKLTPLSSNFTKWSNTLKQFVGNLPTIFLSVFDHFVGLALKGYLLHMFDFLKFYFCYLMRCNRDQKKHIKGVCFCFKIWNKSIVY